MNINFLCGGRVDFNYCLTAFTPIERLSNILCVVKKSIFLRFSLFIMEFYYAKLFLKKMLFWLTDETFLRLIFQCLTLKAKQASKPGHLCTFTLFYFKYCTNLFVGYNFENSGQANCFPQFSLFSVVFFCSLSVTSAKVTLLMIFSHPFRTMLRASRKRRLHKKSAPKCPPLFQTRIRRSHSSA